MQGAIMNKFTWLFQATHQYRKQHTGAGRREIIETFNRARATVLEMRRNTQDYASELPTFVWKKTPPRR